MNYMEFVKPELLVLVPVLYFVGMGIKKSPSMKDWVIPYVLGVAGVLLAVLWVLAASDIDTYKDVAMAVFVALTQGILAAGLSVYANQLAKQKAKGD